MATAVGVSARLETRNDRCDLLSDRALDTQGQPTALPGEKRACEVRYKYDEKGQNVWQGWFDASGKPVRRAGCGEHAWSYKYDDKGRVVEDSFLDLDGKLMNCRQVVTYWATNRYEYGDNGLVEKQTQLNVAGKLRLGGWHTVIYSRNADGYVIEKHTLGRGEHFTIYERNDFGRIQMISFLDAQRQPTNLRVDMRDIDEPRGSYHRVELVFDESGRHAEDVYYNAQGRRLLTVNCARQGCWEPY